jgi:hypothetical protein
MSGCALAELHFRPALDALRFLLFATETQKHRVFLNDWADTWE